MATIIGHGVLAFTLGKIAPKHEKSSLLVKSAVYSSMLPDLDVIGFRLGVRYEEMLGHRGLSHSLFFAFVWALLLTLILFRGLKRSQQLMALLVLGFATASHGVLDAMTDGGLGVAFFAPFSNSRYFLPWEPIQVSPIGRRFFSLEGAEVLMSEALWIGFPCAAVLVVLFMLRRHKTKASSVSP